MTQTDCLAGAKGVQRNWRGDSEVQGVACCLARNSKIREGRDTGKSLHVGGTRQAGRPGTGQAGCDGSVGTNTRCYQVVVDVFDTDYRLCGEV